MWTTRASMRPARIPGTLPASRLRLTLPALRAGRHGFDEVHERHLLGAAQRAERDQQALLEAALGVEVEQHARRLVVAAEPAAAAARRQPLEADGGGEGDLPHVLGGRPRAVLALPLRDGTAGDADDRGEFGLRHRRATARLPDAVEQHRHWISPESVAR